MPKNPVISRVFSVFYLSLLSSKYQKGIEPILIFVGRPPHPLRSPKSVALIAVPSGGQSRVRSLMLPRFAQSAYRFTPLTAHLWGSPSATPKKGTVEAKASTALFRLPIIPPQTAYTMFPMGESLCKGLCPLHPQPPLGTVDGFALQERECSQGFKGGDFRQKILPVP